MSEFTHLHVHSEYSLLDGAIRLDALIKRAQEYQMDAVAVTDHGTMFGAVEFYEKASKAKIKPIIGCECYIAPNSRLDKSVDEKKGLRHLVLIAENQEGYSNLCKLVTIAQIEGFYYKPRIDHEVLEKYHKGLIALSACLHGEIPALILDGKLDKAIETAKWYNDLFGQNNFFLEVQHNLIPEQRIVNENLVEIHNKLSIPLVATNDCHYLNKSDAYAHEILLCIQTSKTIHEQDRFKFNTDQLYFKSPEEMIRNLGMFDNAIENTKKIAERCHIEFDMKSFHFPVYRTDDGQTADDLLEKMAREGFEQVVERSKIQNPSFDLELYKQRLEKELAVIKSMGFSGYFLVVSDFIKYAKRNKIPVGPGRGSAAGSLVAYALQITDLDPIQYNLIFERFLNPARKSMPDIDVDFCIEGREQVFKYVVEKYGGGDYVAQIITFGKMKSKAVIRDVGRAMGLPLSEVDGIAKMVPDVLNINLKESMEQEPRFETMAKEKREIAQLLEICLALEGLPRHASTHAAGVVIGDKPLVNYLPLYKGKNDEVVTQFDMKYVEKIGLVKFDFLGLRNLTVIEQALQFIRDQGKTPPDIRNIDLSDKPTYKLLQTGDTTGVFQLESTGMKELMRRLKPECFDDIIALVALYRPGPLDSGMVDDFVERKHGRTKVEYLFNELEPILKDTYGVIVYQEQVMMIASALADYSMSEADDLRKAMGKKITEILAKHRERFMDGSGKKHLDTKKASHIFDLMEKFGGYGFNKSHSAAYALIAYQTAWLKTHYPVEFMAALLTSEMGASDAVAKFINECRMHSVPVLPPDINESDKKFTAKNNKIRFGLLALKNVGEGAIDAIIEARGDKPFKSIFDFCERVDLKRVNKRVFESLIKCGAFSSTKAKRSQLMTSFENAVEFGQKVQREKNSAQLTLFGEEDNTLNYPVLVDSDEWEENLLLAYEKEVLGFYITGHPLEKYRSVIERFANADSESVREKQDRIAVRIGGFITNVKPFKTKKGDDMAFVKIEDLKGSIEVIAFSEVYGKTRDLINLDTPVIVQGMLQKEERDDEENFAQIKIIADEIVHIDEADQTWTSSIRVKLDMTRLENNALQGLYNTIQPFKGTCESFLHLLMPGKTEAIIALPDNLRLKCDTNMIRSVNTFLGYDAVETFCKPAVLQERKNGRKGNNKWNKANYG